MATAKGGGKLHPLPFTTFGEIAALGLKVRAYCSRCYEHRSIDPAAEHLRDRCFATTRFRCTEIRYTGNVCGSLGSVDLWTAGIPYHSRCIVADRLLLRHKPCE